MDGAASTLTLRPLVGKGYSIVLDELAGFSDCSLPSWLNWYGKKGAALYLKGGGHVQLNEISMVGIDSLMDLFRAKGIPFYGEERCWFYPFVKSKYRFDPK